MVRELIDDEYSLPYRKCDEYAPEYCHVWVSWNAKLSENNILIFESYT